METDEPARYRFGPLERRGLVAGWRGGQLGAVAVALIVAIALLRASPTLPGVFGALTIVGIAVAAATWPIAGRTAEEWAPDAVRQLSASSAARSRRGSGPFTSLRVLVVDTGGAEAAVVHDVVARRYTCVLPARGSGFFLLGARDKEARVASWAGVLSSLARQGSALHRLQWVARCLPDDGVEVRRHLAGNAVIDTGGPAYRSYRALLDSESAVAQRHEVLLSVTVDAGRAARAVRASGGKDVGACTVLLRETALVRRQLADAGIQTGAALDRSELQRAMGRAYDAAPAFATPEGRRTAGAGCNGGWPWPMAVEGSWSLARVDATWHVTYWVAEWPRRDVGADFLGPLLVSDVRRSVSLVMEPIAALEAARRIEQARTADIADAELRRRGGFLHSVRRRREEEVLVTRESELADGHAPYRFAGYVTVTSADRESLDEACARTEQAAGRAGLELRRCYGAQDRAFACTLPLGRGLH